MIRHHTVFLGPNCWDRSPVIYCVVDAEPDTRTPAGLDRLADQYAELATRVHEGTALPPRCIGMPGDFGSIMAGMALDLQRAAGVPVDFCFGRQRTTDPGFDVAVQHRHPEVGLLAIRLATRWLGHLVAPDGLPFDLIEEFGRLATVNETSDLGVMGRALSAAAAERGIPWSTVDPRGRIVELGDGCVRKRMRGLVTSATPAVSVELARDKHLTNRYLHAAGLPVPQSIAVRSLAQAIEAAQAIGYPVVLKPADQGASVGVALDVRDDDDVRTRFPAVVEAARSPRVNIVVERFIHGNDYRVLVVDDAIAAVAQRLYPQVIGDGAHTIRELIKIENADPRRSSDASRVYKKISVDDRVRETLERERRTLDDVPPLGQPILLKLSGSRSDGALSVDVTDTIHPANAKLLRTATRVLGLDIAGIDVITPDISRPILDDGGAIIEINEGSAFNLHLFPAAGSPRDPGPAIMEMLFPLGSPVRVPVIAVMAHDEAASICAFIARAASESGRAAGVASRDGVSIDAIPYPHAEHRNPAGPRTILNNPDTEFAIVEVDAESIVEGGLGFDRCDVAIVLSLSGLQTPYGQPVETVLFSALDPAGVAILDASDPAVFGLLDEIANPTLLCGLESDDARLAHLIAQGHRVVVTRETTDGTCVTIVSSEGEHERIDIGTHAPRTGERSMSMRARHAAIAAVLASNC